MTKVDLTQLIESGAHFGHLTRRWNPKNEILHLYGKEWDSYNRFKKNTSPFN